MGWAATTNPLFVPTCPDVSGFIGTGNALGFEVQPLGRSQPVKNSLSNLTSSRRLNTGLCFLLWALCSFSVIFISSLSLASELQKRTWSFRFNNVAVGDMLKRLSEATGVEISTNKLPDIKPLTRSYENQTIENIIRDVFRGTSYALVWDYGENHLASIGICFLNGGGGRSPSLSADSGARSKNRVVNRGLSQKPPRSRRQISQPKKPLPGGAAASKSKSKTAAKERNDDDEDEDEDEDEMDEDEMDEDEMDEDDEE